MSIPQEQILLSWKNPPRVGNTVYALSVNGGWFNVKILHVTRNGYVSAQVIPSDLKRYRERSGSKHNGRWNKRLRYSFDQNDIEFHKR